MTERTLIASATNLLRRGFLVVPTDRRSTSDSPTNGLYAVARALAKTVALKTPDRAIAVIDGQAPRPGWPDLLAQQVPALPALLEAYGFTVISSDDELNLVASYTAAARAHGDDVLIVGVDKRFAQLVSERVWWFDANKDVRYTTDIVVKRFTVPPTRVAQWLALVGDEDELPGVAGIGAKGATQILTEHESVAAAIDAAQGRLGKRLQESKDSIAGLIQQAHLDTARALPIALTAARYETPSSESLNRTLEALAFKELLVASANRGSADVCLTPEAVTAALSGLGSGAIAIEPLLEDPHPAAEAITGVALANASGQQFYVPRASAGWATLCHWLGDASAAKSGHSLVRTQVALQRQGVTLAGVVTDSECQSHLVEPSNWATHDLAIVARQVLGVALADDESVRGTGKSRKTWESLGIDTAAQVAGTRAAASAAISAALAPRVDGAQLTEYLALQRTLVRMELHGLMVDADELTRAETAFIDMETELEKRITDLAGHSFNINSSKQLGEVLFEQLKLPVVLHTKTGWSTSIEALERIEHAHPIVSLVQRWRGLRRLRDSWIETLRRCIDVDQRVHSRFHLARSFTGHLINTNPDLGRVPGRTPEMARIRRAFVAPPGHLLMSVDFSQLGLYVLAHLTQDPALVEPLRAQEDMHRLTAAAVLEKPVDQLTYEERQIGKVVNFATFAGQGASALGQQLGLTPTEAKAYVARFDKRYAKVRAFQDEQLRLARERGYLLTIAGRKWPIGALESLDPMIRSSAERLARRGTHEGSVSDVSRRALLNADNALRSGGLKTIPVLQIFDEVLFELPENELNRAVSICTMAMRNAFELTVPVRLGVEAGPNWADMQPIAF